MMLLPNSPGGSTLSSSIDFTLEINTIISVLILTITDREGNLPLFEDDSDAFELPGSSELQYRVFVYG